LAPTVSAPVAAIGEVPPEAIVPMVSPIPAASAEFAAAAEPAVAAAIPWAELLLAGWFGGALLFLAWRFVSYRRMRRDLLAEARPVGEAGKIRLVETPAVSGPVAFGLIDKVVALPPMFMALEDRAARDFAIAHELAHHRGRDLAANILAQPLLALHWFNPLAWLAWRAMRHDQEAACDARVVAAQGRQQRARYAEVIASFAAGPRFALAAPMACPMVGEKGIIHRLRSLTMDDVSRRRRLIGRGLLIAGGLALPLSATVTYAASDIEEVAVEPSDTEHPRQVTEHRMVIVDVDDGADPDDADLHTRTVTRNGRTVVLKTDRPLSDAEADEKVDRAFASMDRMGRHMPPIPPLPPTAPLAPTPPTAPVPPMPDLPNFEFNSWGAPTDPDFEKNMQAWGKQMEKWGEEYGERYAQQAQAMAEQARRSAPQVVHSCDGNPQSVTRNETTSDGRQKIIICERVAKRQALGGLRSARNTIARDRQIDPEVRDEVLQELDSEIERIESDS
jgi:beta-lactamase regulating signal transducer with metallopeptidase domain